MKRTHVALFAICVLAFGIGLRKLLPPGFVSKYLGVALWATLVYALVVFVRPALHVRRALLLALAISWSVEFFQLTSIPMQLAGLHVIFAWILGVYFSVWDLPAYVVGIAFGALAHGVWRRRAGPEVSNVRI